MPTFIDLSGTRYGRLLVLNRSRFKRDQKHIYWDCLCDCGKSHRVSGDNLKSGDIQSCGCLLKELLASGGPRLTHGATRHGQHKDGYWAWAGMIARCTYKKHRSYARYGGKGVTVCKRWRNFANFDADMGPRPSPRHSIERINNELGYKPKNCKWATDKEQANNRRIRVNSTPHSWQRRMRIATLTPFWPSASNTVPSAGQNRG